VVKTQGRKSQAIQKKRWREPQGKEGEGETLNLTWDLKPEDIGKARPGGDGLRKKKEDRGLGVRIAIYSWAPKEITMNV